jgi:hypothetical protein
MTAGRRGNGADLVDFGKQKSKKKGGGVCHNDPNYFFLFSAVEEKEK